MCRFGIVCLLALLLASCSDSGMRFRSACGIVVEGRPANSMKESSAEEVIVTGFFAGNVLTLRKTENNDLLTIVLHGLAPIRNEDQLLAAQDFVEPFLGQQAFFFQASRSCRVNSGEFNRLIPGYVFIDSFTSLSEELLLRGLAEIDGRNQCGSRQLEGCQTGLLLEGQPA